MSCLWRAWHNYFLGTSFANICCCYYYCPLETVYDYGFKSRPAPFNKKADFWPVPFLIGIHEFFCAGVNDSLSTVCATVLKLITQSPLSCHVLAVFTKSQDLPKAHTIGILRFPGLFRNNRDLGRRRTTPGFLILKPERE